MAQAKHRCLAVVRTKESGIPVTKGEGGGGVAFAVQLHRDVKPESGLVGIVEHIVVNKR